MNHASTILSITLFSNKYDKLGEQVDVSLADLFATEHHARGTSNDTGDISRLEDSKDGPAIVLATLQDGLSRAQRSIQSVTGIGLDLDCPDDSSARESFSELLRAKWVFWAYSTHKHRAAAIHGKPRYRIILPFEKPVSVEQHRESFDFLCNLIGSPPIDTACRDASRLHYLPSTFDANVTESISVMDGVFFDPLSIKSNQYPSPKIVYPSREKEYTAPENEYASSLVTNKVNSWLLRLPNDDLKPPVRNLLNGEPFAESGQRHNIMRDITWKLAGRFPGLTRGDVTALFKSSLEKMEHPTIEDVWLTYRSAVEKHAVASVALSNGTDPYTDEELSIIAGKLNVSVEQLNDLWCLLYKGTELFILTEKGGYVGPYARNAWKFPLANYLKRVRQVRTVNRAGQSTIRSPDAIVGEGWTDFRDIVPSLIGQQSRFDIEAGVLYHAIRPRRVVVGEFNEMVDTWLRLLAGDKYEKLLDWLAVFPDLNKLVCALYLGGEPGGGKSLLAHGLARIWVDGPPGDLEIAMGSFNAEVSRCPLIVGDEMITSNPRYQQSVTKILRKMIASGSRTLTRKYQEEASLHGAIRIMLTANNEYLLRSSELATARDLRAIAERFMYIEVGPEPKKFLESLPKDMTQSWIYDDTIGKHAIHLMENRVVVKPRRRFWVEGSVGAMHRILISSSKWNGMVCEWIVRYLQNPVPVDNNKRNLVRRFDGGLYINPQAVIDGWKTYLSNQARTDPETMMIGGALRAISETQITISSARNIRYWKVNMEIVATWAESNGIGDPEALVKKVTDHGGSLDASERIQRVPAYDD